MNGYGNQRGEFEIYLQRIWERHRQRIWIVPIVVRLALTARA